MGDTEKDLLIHWRNVENGESTNSTRDSYDDDMPDIVLPNRGTASTAAAIFIVVNAAMGAGLLNFPKAFANAGGIGPAIAMEMTFTVLIVSSLFILAYCANRYQCSTYQEVIERTSGKGFGIATEICIILYMFGTCIAMLIIIGDQFDEVMEVAAGKDFCQHWYMNRKFTIAAFGILIVLPLCIPKGIEFLRHASIVGVLATIIVVIAVIVQYFVSDKTPTYEPSSPDDWALTFRAAPAIFFAYQCHVSSVPVYAALKRKTMTNWSIVIIAAVTLCATAYTVTGVFGYLTLGDAAKSDVLQSYDAGQPSVIAARISVVIAMVTSYPIVHFCGRSALLTLLQRTSLDNFIRYHENAVRYVVTSTWFFATLALALLVPNIGVAIGFVGGIAACFILVFPGVAMAMVARNSMMKSARSYALMFYGLFLFVVGVFLFGEITTRALLDDLSGSSTEQSSECYSRF